MKVEDDLYKIRHYVAGKAGTFAKINCAQESIPTRLDGFCTAYAQIEACLNRLEFVPALSMPKASHRFYKASNLVPIPVVYFTMSFTAALAIVSGNSGVNQPAPTLYTVVPLNPACGDVDDCSVPGVHRLEMHIDAFGTVIDYRHYRLRNSGAYIEPYPDLSLHKLKRKVELLYSTMELFSRKHPKGTLRLSLNNDGGL